MLLRSLVTIAAITISSAESVVPVEKIDLIKQAVVFMTRPDLIIKETPELQRFGAFTKNADIHDAQVHEGFRQTLTSLHAVGDENWPRLVRSVAGFHAAQDKDLQKIYTDSMYSRLHDLADANPNTAHDHLEVAIGQLRSELVKNLEYLKGMKLPLMGDRAEIAKLHKSLEDFSNNKAVPQRWAHVIRNIPVGDVKMRYLTVNQVNEELKKWALLHPRPSAKAAPTRPQAYTGGQIRPRPGPMVEPHAAQTVAAAA